jgi:hypothetical protein
LLGIEIRKSDGAGKVLNFSELASFADGKKDGYTVISDDVKYVLGLERKYLMNQQKFVMLLAIVPMSPSVSVN